MDCSRNMKFTETSVSIVPPFPLQSWGLPSPSHPTSHPTNLTRVFRALFNSSFPWGQLQSGVLMNPDGLVVGGGQGERGCEVFWVVRDEPTLSPLKPVLCSSGLSWSHPPARLYFRLGWRGGGYRSRDLCWGCWLAFGSGLPATHERAGPCLWPGLSSWPGCREAQAGALREVAGPQPLAVVAFRRLWAVSWSFESGRVLGSSQGLCQPASVPSTQLVEEHRCSGISGNHIVQMNFPGNQYLVSLKTEVHLIPLRMFWLADSGFEELTSSGSSFSKDPGKSAGTVSPIPCLNITFPVSSYLGYY